MILTAVITIIGAYLLGSISFAVIFTKLFIGADVRNFGSGNAGTTNVMRAVGFLPGALTFLCDALKGFVACMAGKMIFEYIFEATGADWALPVYGAYICGICCMLGHIFPLFYGFKGGKGIAVAVGIFAVCCPLAIICGLAVFALVVLISNIVSLSSLSATVVVVILSFIFHDDSAAFLPQAIMALTMGTMVTLTHRENIKRLINGTEKKLTIRR